MPKLQLLENPEVLICNCTIRNTGIFFVPSNACMTADGQRFAYGQFKADVENYLVFPYTLQEYADNTHQKYVCKKCNHIPFKLIEVEKYHNKNR